MSRSASFRSCFYQDTRTSKVNPDEGLIKNEAWLIKAEHDGSEASAFLAWGFFRAELLIKKVANLFDENGGEIFMAAVSGKVNLAGVAAVAAPEAGHVGGGKCVDSRKEGKVGPTEGSEMLEGGRPIQARAEDTLQIGLCRWTGGPLREGLQEIF